MITWNWKRKALGFSVLFLSAFVACEKPDGEISEDVLEQGDLLAFNSSTGKPFTWKVQRADSIQSQNLSVSPIGAYNDPFTGSSSFGAAFQLRLSTSGVTFSQDSVEVDSVILSLNVTDIYGLPETEHTFLVQELSNALTSDSTYFSNQNFAVLENNLLADDMEAFVFSLDSIDTGEELKESPQIKLPLEPALGERLLFNNLPQNTLTSSDDLLAYFNGLQVKVTTQPAAESGSVGLINLLSIFSKLDVFYHQPGDTVAQSYAFNINTSSIRTNVAEHAFEGAFVEPELSGMDTAQYGALKTLGGLISSFTISNLDTLKELAPVGIAFAELFIPVKQDAMAGNFEPSERVVLVELNEDGSFRILPDQLEGENYFGGAYDAEKGGYTFRVARFVQQYTTRTKPFFGLAVVPSFSGVRANRTLLLKDEEGGLRPELVVYFADL